MTQRVTHYHDIVCIRHLPSVVEGGSCFVYVRGEQVPHLPPEAFGFHHVALELYQNQTYVDAASITPCDGSGEVQRSYLGL